MSSAGGDLFAPLPEVVGGWRCLAVDPPWRFASNSDARPGRNARRHYATLSTGQIATLPVSDVAAKDALMWLWIPTCFLVIGAHIEIMRAWGFKATALGLVWVKLRRGLGAQPSLFFTERDLFFGPGLTLRRNVEVCVLGRRGKPKRLAKDVFEVILTPVRRHSEKPDEFYRRVERYCDGPRLDLFARGPARPGWSVWGDEAEPRSSVRPLDRARSEPHISKGGA
jgi:N6-adenosine-specific RNA methylase IME4